MEQKTFDNLPAENLAARVPAGLPDRFRKTVPEGYKIGHALAAAANLWIDLPEDVRLHLLAPGNKDSFVAAVQGIVDAALQKRTLPGKPHKKREAVAGRHGHTGPK